MTPDESVSLRDFIERILHEMDKRYADRDTANKEAIRAAFASAERAAEKTEAALKEYKVGANEWRDTVRDLMANKAGVETTKDWLHTDLKWVLTTLLTLAVAVWAIVHKP